MAGSARVCYYNPYAFWAGIVAVVIGFCALLGLAIAYFARRSSVVVVRVSAEDAYEPSGPTKCFDCEGQPRMHVFPSHGDPKLF